MFALAPLLITLSTNTGRTALKGARDVGKIAAPTPTPDPQWAVKGRFDAGPSWLPETAPFMVHASVLPDGRVLFWGRDKASTQTSDDVIGESTASLWTPGTNTFQAVNNDTTNLFCSGHSLLADGRMFVAGGHANPAWTAQAGDNHTNVFNPANNTWSNGPIMDEGRWYPYTLMLENGKVAIMGGAYEASDGSFITQRQPEIYNPEANTLELMNPPDNPSAGIPRYPLIFLDPIAGTGPGTPNANRGVFVAGPGSYFFWNPTGGNNNKGSWTYPLLLPGGSHHEGSAVMYDSDNGKILLTGGRILSGSAQNNVQRNAETIMLNQANPQWQSTQAMLRPRTFHTLTVLPDGKVLATGGVPCKYGHRLKPCWGDFNENDQNLVDLNQTLDAEMWDPLMLDTTTGLYGTWKLMARPASGYTRSYHSIGLLLPDATVLVAGGGGPDGMRVPPDVEGDTGNLRRQQFGQRNVDIYLPPYLFDASGPKPRPSINSVAAHVSYGQQFTLTYGNASSISKVSWVRLPSVTHGFSTDQRINFLVNEATPGVPNQQSVTAPTDPRKCPPGYYMLFIFDQNGTPSVARIVRISNEPPPPEFTAPEIGARAALDASGRIHVFYRHQGDTQVRYIKQTGVGSDTWTAPATDTGGFATITNPQVVADSQKRLWVFTGGTNNGVYVSHQTSPGSATWSVNYVITGTATNSNLAVARNVDGRLQLFYRGPGNSLWHVRQTSPGADVWDSPVNLGGALLSEPVAGMNANGQLEVFVKGTDSALYAIRQTSPAGTAWSAYYRIEALLASSPAVARNADGALQVCYRNPDKGKVMDRGVLCVKQKPNTTSWGKEEVLGGVTAGAPAMALNADGIMQVFIRWQGDNSLRTVWQTSPGGDFGTEWSNMGGAGDQWLNAPVLDTTGRMYVFMRGTGYDLYFNRQIGPSSYSMWAGFFPLGDFAHSF